MSYYSVVTIYPDHFSTVEMPTIEQALTEFNYRKAVISEIDPENITVRILRVSKHMVIDVTPGRENTN